ncbi:MAG: MarP family serine protease [Actinomycetota bacterium]|nr:MarP family serine protease [Actinomycetota bacterium]
MNLLDLFLIVLIVFAAISGFRRGALFQIFTFGGLLVGLVVGASVAPKLAGLVSNPSSQSIVALVSFLAIAALGDAAGWMVGAKVWAATRTSRLAPLDAAGGSMVSVVAVLLAIWFIGLNLANGPFPTLAREIRSSAVVRGLADTLPPPPSLLGQVRKFLNEFGFPEVFAGLPPAPGGAVKGPTKGQARHAFDDAKDSTLRIVGQACGRIEEGSGFVVAPQYVITNAHVVAGEHSISVQTSGGASQPGVPVLFDPRIDVAVLRVASTSEPALHLAGHEFQHRAVGAVLGYPEGGGLKGVGAASRRIIHAVGRDIYGRGTVTRDIYELQTVVRPGNSGGPFVLANGEVAGLVFAASTTDPRIGYAITSTEVGPDVRRAIGETAPVSTGPCTR